MCKSNALEQCIACNNGYYFDGNECILKPEENNNNLETTILKETTTIHTTIRKETTTISPTIPKETTTIRQQF